MANGYMGWKKNDATRLIGPSFEPSSVPATPFPQNYNKKSRKKRIPNNNDNEMLTIFPQLQRKNHKKHIPNNNEIPTFSHNNNKNNCKKHIPNNKDMIDLKM